MTLGNTVRNVRNGWVSVENEKTKILKIARNGQITLGNSTNVTEMRPFKTFWTIFDIVLTIHTTLGFFNVTVLRDY